MKIKLLYPILIILLLLVFSESVWSQKNYKHVFNPMKSFVDATEKPLRDELILNGRWQFMPVFENKIEQFQKPDKFEWETVPLKVPSPWNINSFAEGDGGDFLAYPSYPQKWEEAKMGWIKKDFELPESWAEKLVKLHFEAIAGFAKIYVNGQLAGENLDIFFPTELDITAFLKPGKNEILVGIAKASLTDDQGKYGRRNYVAGSFWGQHIVGIWQDVSLIAVPAIHISNVFVQPDVANDQLAFEVTVQNNTAKEQSVQLDASIKEWFKDKTDDVNLAPVQNGILNGEVLQIAGDSKVKIAAGESAILKISATVDGKLKYWTPETPNLYGSVISLKTGKKKVADIKYTRFGWRQFTIDGTHFLLNGERIVLKGDSWHFMGVPQMTRRYAWAWFQMLKNANANAVRLHAQPYPSFYLDVADEMGICVLDETGIWSSDGGPKMDSDDYWEYCKDHVKSLVMRDRNHASVFGWSVCNETLPVAIHVYHAPESIVQRQVDEINNWIAIVKENDPTRDWISGDGEDMRPTDLPTVIGHYGDENSMKNWSSQGKPWGVGETGMGYYGTPKQISAINENRAYESQLGRMEGLATEAYDLIGKQLGYDASYASVFNIIWYGLKPLPFGLKDTSRPSIPEDGIFFPEYQEGIPGMQPERLGPYTSTVNPGYDPGLPLYDPWPMFHAIQAINSNPQKNFKIEEKNRLGEMQPLPEKIKQVGIIAGENSGLKEYLVNMGVPFVDLNASQEVNCGLIVIDGRTATLGTDDQQIIKSAIESGAKILVWGVKPENLSGLNKVLPYPVKLTNRESTSFILKSADPVLAGLGNKDFYFTELIRRPVMTDGLSGDLVKNGTILVEACNTDWGRWNARAEYLKTAAVYRSEHEAKPEGTAIVKVATGNAEFYISNINLLSLRSEGEDLFKKLLTNLGVELKDVSVNSLHALSSDGELVRALVLKADAGHGTMGNGQFIKEIGKKGDPEMVQSGAQGFLDLGRNVEVALSFWVYSPRSMVDLLVEPDMPKLDLRVEGDQEASIFVNGKSFDKAEGDQILENLPLEKGWNHLFIKMKRSMEGKDWQTKIKLESNKEEFIEQLNSAVAQ
ncbi:glycoside hydrolase family 2 protein [Draconibacterium mangrovi]|uniref:glycoside hydrolase family 2 protein n=1 Tax=Draconibacterium mangrovi TaxID=2697469 RepID=UPI0013CF9B85|nr:sugar-binding domain-containing protein [Draconibacterium mangrovi]